MHGQTIARVMIGSLHRIAKERKRKITETGITPGDVADAAIFVDAGQWNLKDAYAYFCILLHEPLSRKA